MTGIELSADPSFLPHQADFFHRVVPEVAPGSVHLLIGPPGTGKTFAVGGTVSELVRTGRLDRVLIVSPAALTAQWADVMNRRGHESIVVNPRTLRLLRQQTGPSSGYWPVGIYASSVDLAKRSDVQSALLATPWDLVVIDGAQALTGQRLQLVERFAASEPAPALLMTSPVRVSGEPIPAAKATVIDWSESIQELRSRTRTPLVRDTRMYRSTTEESAVAELTLECARQLGRPTGPMLLKRESSSVNSLEATLIRLVERPGEEADHREVLGEALQHVEQLQVDSRLECMKALVAELAETDDRRVAVFCEYRDTLDYLSTAVDQSPLEVFALHSAVSESERQEITRRWSESGGILITTTAGLSGLQVDCSAVIHYDLPTSRTKFAQRESRYDRFGREQPCTVYFLRDEARARPLDDHVWEAAQAREPASPDGDEEYVESYWAEIDVDEY